MDGEITLIVTELAKSARSISSRAGDDRTMAEAGRALEAALRSLENLGEDRTERAFPTRGPLWFFGFGWHSSSEIIGALARLDGPVVFGPGAHPRRYRTPLLAAFVDVSREIGRPWVEGADEMNQRRGMIWSLRDLGLWPMPQH